MINSTKVTEYYPDRSYTWIPNLATSIPTKKLQKLEIIVYRGDLRGGPYKGCTTKILPPCFQYLHRTPFCFSFEFETRNNFLFSMNYIGSYPFPQDLLIVMHKWKETNKITETNNQTWERHIIVTQIKNKAIVSISLSDLILINP